MDIRINHQAMSLDQKHAFIVAILRLKNEVDSVLRPGQQSRYDDFVQIHKSAMGLGDRPIPNPHYTPLFFPWHRVLIRQFELALQDAAGDTSITLPYWNWRTVGADNPFTEDFLGGDGDPEQEQRVTSGVFASQHRMFELKVWEGETGDPALRRNFGNAEDRPLPTGEIDTALSRTPFWSGPTGWSFRAEFDLHDAVHLWVGGNMTFPTSPNDPVFFLHHCYMDLLWERWKRQHPLQSPYGFPEQAQGVQWDSALIFQPDDAPAPWPQTWTVEQTLSTESFDYQYRREDLE